MMVQTTTFEDGWEFYQYSKHYRTISLRKGSKTKTLKIEGWMVDLIREVKHEGRQELKREIHNVMGIIS